MTDRSIFPGEEEDVSFFSFLKDEGVDMILLSTLVWLNHHLFTKFRLGPSDFFPCQTGSRPSDADMATTQQPEASVLADSESSCDGSTLHDSLL